VKNEGRKSREYFGGVRESGDWKGRVMQEHLS
jgi:hypothetical protein